MYTKVGSWASKSASTMYIQSTLILKPLSSITYKYMKGLSELVG